MQSSIWKLLTAAGIIGIGTLIVLEVQNRLPMQRSGVVASPASTGKELSVTPDASTEFDETILSSSLHDGSDPAAFDRPGAGLGKPAPPATDNQFVGAPVERTVRKDDLFDSESPFGEMLEEPVVVESTDADSLDADAAFAGAAAPGATSITSEASRSTPANTPQTAGRSVATTAGADEFDEPVSPFLTDEPETSTTAKATGQPAEASQAVSTKGRTAVAEKNTMLFFPNTPGSNGTDSSSNTAPSEALSSTTSTTTATDSGSRSATQSTGKTSVNSAATKPNVATPVVANALAATTVPAGQPTARTVQRTSATADEVPSLFVPDPVPDLSTTPSNPAGNDSEPPIFEPAPFERDEISAPGRTDSRPAPRTNPLPAEDSSDPAFDEQFFRDDEPASVPELRPSPVEDETLPFMPDETEPVEPDLPVRPVEPVEEPFPTPVRPRRGVEEPAIPEFGSDLPFQPDNDFGSDNNNGSDRVAPAEPRPLPSADEFPARRDPRLPTDTGTRLPGESARTVSEVMRPQLTIQKRAPNTATVGVSHDYTIVVANEGASSAYDVVVEDELGGAAEFVESKPLAEYNRSTDQLIWNFRELRAGEKKEITVRIRPTGEGTLDGVATVRFKAQVKSATVITAPKLELQLTGPGEVKVGDEVQLTYTIRNRGSGDAANVILRSVLPPGLKHPEGGDLEYEIENLPAGGSEDVDLTVIAAEPGELILVSAEVTSSGVSAAKAKAEIEIVGAQLTLERLGPERRFVGRPAKYQNIVTNESRFEAINAMVVEEVPRGMRFVSASNGGEYNPDNRRIRWSIPRLAAGKQQLLEVELVAEQSGQMETIVEVTENAGFRTPLTENTIVTVEDIHNVTADISRQDEPVAIGARFGFTVTIDNRGTAVARNVEMSIQVPAGIRVLAAGTREVPGQMMSGNVVKYTTVPEIAPNEKMTFKIYLQGEKPLRNAPVQAYLKYDEMPEALIVSESVTVYDDRPSSVN